MADQEKPAQKRSGKAETATRTQTTPQQSQQSGSAGSDRNPQMSDNPRRDDGTLFSDWAMI